MGHAYEKFRSGDSALIDFPSWAINFSSLYADKESPLSLSNGETSDTGQYHLANVSKGKHLQCVAIGPRLLMRGVSFDLVQMTSLLPENDTMDVHEFFAHLSQLKSQATAASSRSLSSNVPAYHFEHLRSKRSFHDLLAADFFVAFVERKLETWYATLSEDDQDIFTLSAEPQPSDESRSTSDASSSSEETDDMIQGVKILVHFLMGRKIFLTRSGFHGIGVSMLQEGDIVAILFGCAIPTVLRDHGGYYTFVGPCRVNGIMLGEMMKFVDDGILKERTFEIR